MNVPLKPVPTRYFELRHTVGFDETSIVGNVYYANYVRWQGRCREIFLKEQCPDVLNALERDLALVTVHCSCDFHNELRPFDEVSIRMSLTSIQGNRITMQFHYLRVSDSCVVASGRQTIAAMRRTADGLVAVDLPPSLTSALYHYRPSRSATNPTLAQGSGTV